MFHLTKKMKGSQIILWVIVIALIIAAIYFFAASPKVESSLSENEGRAVFTITDAAANMGSVSSVKVTIDDVKAHSTSQGWVTISSNSKTYDLLQLKAEGKQALLIDTQLKTDTYNQVRLEVSKVIVVDSQGESEAKLPSNELRIQNEFTVNENSTTSLTFDFIADESLHITGNANASGTSKNKYILAPVIQIETRENAQVNTSSENDVKISGNVKSSIKVGTNLNGTVGIGLNIPASADLTLTSDDKISVRL